MWIQKKDSLLASRKGTQEMKSKNSKSTVQ